MKTGMDESGVTVLEAILTVIVAGIVVALAMQHLAAPPAVPGGVVVAGLEETGGMLCLEGSVYGYACVNGNVGDASLWCDQPDPGRMGSVSFTIGLFIGDMGAVDMSRATVTFATRAGREVLPLTSAVPVRPQNWTVLRRFHRIPGQQADDDDILEPGEQFEVLVYPGTALPPYEQFTVTIAPPGSEPLPVSRTVPPGVTQVMDLG
ncbi:hypothetical protein FGU65_09525 [Methanoculleus sp. FWC-SCC1]|uniref:Type II secretion system protein n=1 Tax=Methanoculleus frigidifontis TaxID=2584085 RepID=A0ABT8MB08_9EURY|nr:hypothetical protein [Methanoculleus sp. FWC-SCC1]MDN7025125.1 hypothetical protein [Methanoculleus sp. FWC-SCC1]